MESGIWSKDSRYSHEIRGVALDSLSRHPYSLPFRTDGLKSTKQRPVGSVGVEALLGQ